MSFYIPCLICMNNIEQSQIPALNSSLKTSRKRRIFKFLTFWTCLITLSILCNLFIARIVIISGHSMEPFFKDGQYVLINELQKKYTYNDVVVAKSEKLNCYIIKRIIGIPGDTIQIVQGYIHVNGEKIKEQYQYDIIISAGIANDPIVLKENEYFLLGDNRNNSIDSRELGPIQSADILGRICFNFSTFAKSIHSWFR